MGLLVVPDLHFTGDLELSIQRRRHGTHFRYVDGNGRPVRDADTLARIRSLAIPPAWDDVWISASPSGHLQATGRDAKGRKQHRYHPEWRAFRDRAKFEELATFGVALPRIRRAVETGLRDHGLTREKVLATVVRLLDTTLVRVGNEEYAQENDSYGLTTLRNRHVKGSAAAVRLVFRGKSGRVHEVAVEERRVARVLRQCQELPGQLLFEYRGDDGACHPVRSDDVNTMLREVSGIDVTAKDFRTWHATRLAASILASEPPPADATEARHTVVAMAEAVSDQLRNTPAVCRASYVHPLVVAEYEAGTLPGRWGAHAPTAPRGLTADERRLLALLRTRRRQAPRSASALSRMSSSKSARYAMTA